MTSPCRQMIYYFVTPVFGWMAVVLILHFTLYQSSKPPFRHERPVILDVTRTNIDSYKRDVYLDWGGTPIISSKFIYGNAKSLLHSAVFFHRGMKTLDASLQGLSLACFLVDCAGFTDLKTEQLFYKPANDCSGWTRRI